jgi:general secretion pathway protein G
MFKKSLAEARIKSENDEGFTLIELLIVIVVLGILAGVVVFGVGTFQKDSLVAACKANLKTVSVAADAYNAKSGLVAADVAFLVTNKYLKTAPPASHLITLTAGTPSSTLTDCTLV